MADISKDKSITKWLITQAEGKTLYKVELPSRRRDWMDVNNGHAYKCLPLSVANGFGWEIKNPIKFDAVWSGSIGHENAIVFTFYPETNEEKIFVDTKQISSHFGNGIITFSSLNFILRTTEGHNVFIKGPTNHFKHGAHALEAVIEADWLPYTFTLNWKITKPHVKVTFEKDEPIACIFPYPRNYLESFEAIEQADTIDSELDKQQRMWQKKRDDLIANPKQNIKDHFTYSRGIKEIQTGEKFEEHQRSIIGCPFMKKILEQEKKSNE